MRKLRPCALRRPPKPRPVLSSDDLSFFAAQGYVVVRAAVEPELCRALVQGIFEFLELPAHCDPSWYAPPVRPDGKVEMYHHQAQWDIRQHPRVYRAFSQLFSQAHLSVSFDRAHFKPPMSDAPPGWDPGGFLHLDGDPLAQLRIFALQGVVALTDTALLQGGFHCLPGWHRRTDEFIALCRQLLPDSPKPAEILGERMYQIPGLRAIPMNEGDLLIWHIGLPHGSGFNQSDRPRLAQYVLMYPTHPQDRTRPARIQAWHDHAGPLTHESPSPFPGDPRRRERAQGRRARLTPLGKRLVGICRWDD